MSTTTPERRATADLAISASDITQADVTDELERSGLAFGELIRLTGESVAETQRALEITAADTIGSLASTQVEIIAAEVLDFDDSGNLREGAEPVVQSLPLITIMDPAVYQWTKVRVQGMFFAQEFTTDSSSKTSTSSTSASAGGSAGGGLLPFFGSARASFQHSRSTTELEIQTAQDTSFGLMRVNAMLQPRADTGVPKPRQMVIGPAIQVALGPVTVNTPPDPTSAPTLRQIDVTVTYTRQDGTPIPGKTLSIEITEGLSWEYLTNADPDSAKTDSAGQVKIRATRTVGAGDTAREPVLSVRLGLVSNDTTLPV